MIGLIHHLQNLIDKVQPFVASIAAVFLRLYLAPVFFIAGMNKFNSFESTVEWFGNPDWGLGLPLPLLQASLATGAELGGAILLILGLGVRFIAIPLMVTMVVAALTVHWQNGWQAIADSSSAFASNLLGPFQFESATGAVERLEAARSLLRENGNYEWLTESGSFVVLNNGIEWAATYFVLLLALFVIGAGKYVSVDYWLARKYRA